jgi:hypothetical protein
MVKHVHGGSEQASLPREHKFRWEMLFSMLMTVLTLLGSSITAIRPELVIGSAQSSNSLLPTVANGRVCVGAKGHLVVFVL